MISKLQHKTRAYLLYLLYTIRKDIFCGEQKGYITIFHDHEGEYAATGAKCSSHDGVLKMLDIEKKYSIKTTYNIVGKLLLDEPDVTKRILEEGHDLASHTYKHDIPSGMTAQEFWHDIQQSKDIFKSFGVSLEGFRSPQSKWSMSNLRVMMNQGLLWNAEVDLAPYPYAILKQKKKLLVRIPVVMDDWGYKAKK